MQSKGIRGAITVEANTEEAIKDATLELLKELVEKNKIEEASISHVFFTLTKDLNVAFPAKFARLDFGWSQTAMMCHHELDVPNSLSMCLRVLIVVNCGDEFEPEFVYLKGAKKLRG
ncbi:MAG: chorismate mutase [Candidatus Gastranaerophilaceae bacterium]